MGVKETYLTVKQLAEIKGCTEIALQREKSKQYKKQVYLQGKVEWNTEYRFQN